MTGPDEFYFNVRNLGGDDVRGKMQYISRDDPDLGREEVPVYNRAGRPMTDREKAQFIAKAERHDYCQRWQVCPPNGEELDTEAVRLETRRVAHDYTRDKRSSSVAYAVHPGTDGRTHAHVLVAGEESELRMDGQDIERTRTIANKRMTERQREREREYDLEVDRARDQELDRDRDRGLGLGGI